jgi:replicative DNA helicase
MTVSLLDAIKSQTDVVQERVNQGGIKTIGLPCGFHKVDQYLLGFRKQQLYILAGRPSMGKTSCAISMALNVAHGGNPIMFVSLEMDAQLLSTRILSARTGIPAERIELGQLSESEMFSVQEAYHEHDKHFIIADESMDSHKLLKIVQEMDKKPSFIVVDYITLLRDRSDHGQTERVTQISGNLREIARICDAPLLALSQLNRSVEAREGHIPILSDLRDSGALEQDAFAVMFVYRPHYYARMFQDVEEEEIEHDAKIIIAKNRQGETGQTTAEFHPKTMVWQQKDYPITHPPSRGGL